MNPRLRILLSALAAVAIFAAGAAFGSRHSALASQVSPSSPALAAHAVPSASVLSAPPHSAPSASVLFASAHPAPAHSAPTLSASVPPAYALTLSAPTLFAPAQSAPTQSAPVNRFGQPRTILSISLLKFRPGVSDADKRAAIEGVRTLAGQIPGIKNIWLKTSRMQPRDFDAAFVIEFASRDAADNYAESPLHDAWSKKLQAIRETSLSPQVTN